MLIRCKGSLKGIWQGRWTNLPLSSTCGNTCFLYLNMEAWRTSSNLRGYHTWAFNYLEMVGRQYTTYTLNEWGSSINKQHIAVTCDEISRIDKHTWTSDHAYAINISFANPHLFHWRGLKGWVVLVVQQSTLLMLQTQMSVWPKRT